MMGIFIYDQLAHRFNYGNGVNSDDIILTITVLSILLSINLKSIFSLRFINHFKNAASFTKTEKIFFYILYSFTVFLTGASFLMLAFWTLPDDIRQVNNLLRDQIILTTGLICATISGTYLCIMGPLLVKAIRRQYHHSINTIGQHIQP